MKSSARDSTLESIGSRRKVLFQACLVLSAATVLFAAFFSSVIFQGKYLAPGDALTYSLSAFLTPPTLWCQTLGCGMPVSADPQYQMWYPVQHLCRLFSDYNALVLSAYVIAFSTSLAFAFSLTKSRLASVVAALVYSMSGFMFAHLGHVTIIHAAAWLPLFLLAIEKSSAKFKWYWFITGEAAVALCLLGGHTQILLMQLMISGLYTLFKASESGSKAWLLICSYVAMCISGLALVGLQLLPTLELASFSPRNDWSFESFVSFSLPPRQLSQLFLPFVFCQPAGLEGYGHSNYLGLWSLTELSGYTGLLPILLGLVALVRGRGRQRWFWLAIAAGALLVATGDATPVARILFKLPVINHFRCPGRYLLLFDLAISVLAALGVGALERAQDSRLRKQCVLAAGGVLFLAGVGSFVWCLRYLRHHFALSSVRPDLSPFSNPNIGIPVLLFALSVSVALLWAHVPKSKLATAVLLITLLADLASFDYFCEWRFWSQPKTIAQASPAVSALQNILQKDPSNAWRVAAPLGDLGGVHCCPPNVNTLWDLPSPAFYSPLVSARMSRFFSDMGTARLQLACRYPDTALDLAAVKYLIVPAKVSIRTSEECNIISPFLPFDARRFEPANIKDDFCSVYVNKRWLPRYRLVHRALLMEANDILQTIQTSKIRGREEFAPKETTLMQSDDADARSVVAKLGKPHGSSQPERVEVLQSADSVTRLRVVCQEPALLIIADQFYPGWHLTVDGKSEKLVRANYVFDAVYLDPGVHMVKIQFEPDAFKLGLSVSVLVVLANIIAVAITGFRDLGLADKIPISNH